MRVLLALMSVLPVSAIELKVDHVTVAGRDVPAMQKEFAAAGIPTRFGGKHSNGQTEMALASFPDGSYLELIGQQPGADASGHEWAKFLMHHGGPCAWAISVADAAREAEKLKRAGIPTAESRNGRRRPDGVQLEWIIATLGQPPHGTFFPFLIQDVTPRERRAFPEGKPSLPAFGGVALVVVAVKDLDAAVARWRTAFALGEPQRQTDEWLGANLAGFVGTPVVLAAPHGGHSWLETRLREFGEAPCAFVLESREPVAGARKGRARWFGRDVAWFDPALLSGARIGVRH